MQAVQQRALSGGLAEVCVPTCRSTSMSSKNGGGSMRVRSMLAPAGALGGIRSNTFVDVEGGRAAGGGRVDKCS